MSESKDRAALRAVYPVLNAPGQCSGVEKMTAWRTVQAALAQPDPAEQLAGALRTIAGMDASKDSDEGYNEWGEAHCFHKAREMARTALAAYEATK